MWQLKKAAPPNKFLLLIIRDKDKLIDSRHLNNVRSSLGINIYIYIYILISHKYLLNQTEI